jgi:hypothetical protein
LNKMFDALHIIYQEEEEDGWHNYEW